MKGKTIAELREGDTAQLTKTVTQADILAFAEVSGDHNPLHVDPEKAAAGAFGGIVAHGMLAAGLISAVIGMQLPGPGTVYLKQSLKFTKPVRPGDTVTARVQVVALDPAKNRVSLRTTCLNHNGEVVLEGDALVKPPQGSF